MKKIILMMAVAVLSGNVIASSDGCEEAVDMADDLDFAKMHVECAEEPVTLYDPKSKASFLSKKKAVVTAYANPTPTTTAVKESTVDLVESKVKQTTLTLEQHDKAFEKNRATHNAGVTFNIREPFSITGGPHSALNSLYLQMASYCPAGWEKLKEWSEPNQDGYYLHYQFQCAQ